MTIKTTCVFSLLFLLVACSEQSVASSPAQKATSEMIPTTNTQSTSAPTVMNILKPTLSPSMIMTIEASMTRAAQQRLVDCDGFPDQNWQMPISTSNNLWRVEFCVSRDTSLPYTRFIKNDGSATWSMPFYETYGVTQKNEEHPNGITDGAIIVERWSYDGKYVYLRPVWCCIDGSGMSFHNVFALYRLDLTTGNLDGIISPGGYSIAFSPSEKFLAFSNGKNLHLLDISNGEDKLMPLSVDYVGVGNFAWAKNEEQLIFVGALDGWDENASNSNSGFSLLLFDVRKMAIKTLITNDPRLLIPSATDAWKNENELALIDSDGNSYVYHIDSGSLSILPK